MTDANEIRDREIQLHGLSGTDDVYAFYYDETNNVRKLHVTSAGLNVGDPGCFVLGGIVHRGSPKPIDIVPLRRALALQPSVNEIKLKHIGKGDFLSVLGSERLGTFLKWILDEGLLIHFQVLDVLYWSIVDIVDSIIINANNPTVLMMNGEIKDALYAALRKDLPGTVDMFYRFQYPGLKREDGEDFIAHLRGLAMAQLPNLSRQQAGFLRFLLDMAPGSVELPFIEGDEENVLIDNFSHFFLHRICLFKNATHILDIEESIKARLIAFQLHDRGVPLANYSFVDSKTDPAIQVSDLIAGLLGKYHSYLSRTDESRVIADREALSPVQARNLGLLRQLVDVSDAENPAFIHMINSMADQEKNVVFLHAEDSA